MPKILAFGEVFDTLLTSSNSFNVWFAILLTLLTLVAMADRPKSIVMAHISSMPKVIEMHALVAI